MENRRHRESGLAAFRFFFISVLTIMISLGAMAELQSVKVGGKIQIRGRYWGNNYSRSFAGSGAPRYVGIDFSARPLGPFRLLSRYDFDSRGEDLSYVEQNTRLHITADFSDDVTSFVEFESFDVWGSDFRSNYVSGTDGTSGPDIKLYQAYIEVRDAFGYPLRTRLGRQEMKLGKGWLVSDNITPALGFIFDGIRLTYDADNITVDGWWHKLSETLAGDEDVDFYGLYATYSGFESVNASAYWLMIRDGATINDTVSGPVGEWVEDLLGHDDYDPTYLHTVGTRIWGGAGAFDFDWELAYQFGEADSVGSTFRLGVYGDTNAEFDAFATDLDIGYTVDMAWQPRFFVGGAYFEGEDNRDFEWGDRLLGGIREGRASVSFNRLFSSTGYGLLLGINSEISNFWLLRAGVNVKPTDKISGGFRVSYLENDEPFETPVIPFVGFWTRENDSHLGWLTFLWAEYQYTEELSVAVIWEHLFVGEGFEEGQFFARNALEFVAGTDDQDADYLHFDINIKF